MHLHLDGDRSRKGREKVHAEACPVLPLSGLGAGAMAFPFYQNLFVGGRLAKVWADPAICKRKMN
jgi:hypothetical protein